MNNPSDGPENCGFTLDRDPRGRLVLIDVTGQSHVDVEPVRCFPISYPEQWVSICDVQGRELACIKQLDALPPEARSTLEEELAGHEFVPIVRRIVRVTEDSDCCRWRIETDRGPIALRIGDEAAVRRLDGRRVMILDTDGIRYLIPDTDDLDKPSRRLLERYL